MPWKTIRETGFAGWQARSCAPSTGAIADDLVRQFAGQAIGHHAAVRNAGGEDPFRVDPVIASKSANQGAGWSAARTFSVSLDKPALVLPANGAGLKTARQKQYLRGSYVIDDLH